MRPVDAIRPRLEATPSTPAQLSQMMRDDLDKWTKVVRAAKIKLGN